MSSKYGIINIEFLLIKNNMFLLPTRILITDPIVQACQIGGPRVACGPIGCLMWPAWIFYDPYMIENCNKLNTFKVISIINSCNIY